MGRLGAERDQKTGKLSIFAKIYLIRIKSRTKLNINRISLDKIWH
jgi:hypothetical protein